MSFLDRREAGRALAARLTKYASRPDVLILALPRGGIPVGYEVSLAIHAPMDVFVVRKLGVPGHEELAMGAVAGGGVRVLNEDMVRALGVSDRQIEAITKRELSELKRQERLYRTSRPEQPIEGRTILLIDDGLATGSTMRAAATALRRRGPSSIIVAVPVGAPATCEQFADLVDETICVLTPEPFMAVGRWYEDFSQTSDDEVRELLSQSAQPQMVHSS